MLTATTGLILAYGPPAVKLRYTLYPATTDVLGFQRRLTVCDSVAVPDPDRVSTTGVLAALLASEILPEVAPLLWGVKVSETGALCPAARVLGSDNPARRNSELVEVADVMVTLEPVAVSVAVKVLLVPTVTLPKSNTPALDVNRPTGDARSRESDSQIRIRRIRNHSNGSAHGAPDFWIEEDAEGDALSPVQAQRQA